MSGARAPDAAVVALPARPVSTLPWSISPTSVKFLSETALGEVMRSLVPAEAHLRGCDMSRVRVNAEEKAGDDGCDAWTPAPQSTGPWLSSSETCWQFKAGAAGQPSRLRGEVGKSLPSETLRNGGRFVVVASGAANGEAGRRQRLQILQREATRLGLPTQNIDVFTSESVAQWLSEHPSVGAPLAGLPAGIVTLGNWSRDRRHAEKWYPTKAAAAVIEKATKALDPQGGLGHVHVVGRPGVGKTRFALELCRQAPWRESVLYIPQQADVSVAQILAALASGPERTLVLVVDEAPADKLPQWAADAERCGGRVRLLTIGHSSAPEATPGVEIEIPPLEPDAMGAAVGAWYPGMPREHVEFVVEFADGYVRLARLAADAVAANPGINVRDLLRSAGVRRFISTLLPATEDRTALHVVAALNSVGWDGAIGQEGRLVAEHLGLSWTAVRARVQALDDAHGIAPRAGDLRFISPNPLGVYLAIDAWESYPDLMRSLRDKLPEGKAVSAYYERLRAVMASPRAREVAREELDRFFPWERFKAEADVERWAALSLADAPRAAYLAHTSLAAATREQRLEITGRARRRLVDALVELTWGAESFHDAALGLAALAEAENESWGNNATGEFVARFQLFLGGTASPYLRRLDVIDMLLRSASVACQKLAVAALAQVGNGHESRSGPPPRRDAPRPPEWHPRSGDERTEAVAAALQRLERVASDAHPELAEEVGSAAQKTAMLIRVREVRDAAVAFLRAAVGAYPGQRERIGGAVSDVVSREVKFWKQLTEPEVASLRALEEELQDNTEQGRIRRAVGRPRFDRDAPDLDPVAELIVGDSGLLTSLWPWLTSGEANFGWDLGRALAMRDKAHVLLPKMLAGEGRGRDGRLPAGYLSGVGETAGAKWVDDVLDKLLTDQPEDVQFAAELTWRCAPTSRGGERVLRLVEAGALDQVVVEQLVYGRWSAALPLPVFLPLLRAVSQQRRYREAGLALVHDRASSHEAEWEALKPDVLALLTDPQLVRARGDMREYYWVELAKKLAHEQPRQIARALFAAQGLKGEEHPWFLEHSRALPVLKECIAADAAVVWAELRAHLESPGAGLFTTGFPEDVLDDLPHEAILEWVAEQPEARALLIANLVPKSLRDDSLGSRLLSKYPKLLSGVYFSGWVSGAWSGNASEHWDSLGVQVKSVGEASTLPAVRAWADWAAQEFRRMAARERKREAEERLRGW